MSKIGLIITMSKYKKPWREIKSAEEDGYQIRQFLERTCKFLPSNVDLLPDCNVEDINEKFDDSSYWLKMLPTTKVNSFSSSTTLVMELMMSPPEVTQPKVMPSTLRNKCEN